MTRRLHPAAYGVLVFVLIALMAIVVVAPGILGFAGESPSTPAGPGPSFDADCASEPPADFADPADAASADVLGWVDGYWYDEPLDVEAADGLTTTELDAVAARTAARIEVLRCLTFDEIPPIEVLSREEFQEGEDEAFETIDEDARRFENAVYATLLTIGHDEDAVDVYQDDRGERVRGYYDIATGDIVVVTNDPEDLPIDEKTLAHELGHALQDQHFDLSRYAPNTTDGNAGNLGLIEGDVGRIEHEYLARCTDGGWNESCIVDDEGTTGSGGAPPNWGLYFAQFQPYSDGPSFVEHVYREGGWEAVNDLYDEFPDHSLYTISPDTYGTVEPVDLDAPDPGDAWTSIVPEGSPGYEVVGQAGIASILMGQTVEAAEAGSSSFTVDSTAIWTEDDFDPHEYDHPAADGWRGDRLDVYANERNETATVWTIAWENAEAAEQFAEAYEVVAEFRGGEPVESDDDGNDEDDGAGGADVFTFDGTDAYDMALGMALDDDRLTIVTAPSVAELTDVHPGLAAGDDPGDVGNGSSDDADEGDDASGDTGETGTDAGDDADEGDGANEDGIPGFDVTLAILAVLSALSLARRR